MSKSQNIYDNEIFFEGYMKIRDNKNNYNEMQEKPAMRRVLPDIYDKKVLDLGCGYGENCTYFVKKGASKVIGVDISEKMLEIARLENNNSSIEFLKMDMKEINKIDEKFDIVYSSLAFHYIDDFKKLLVSINNLLKDNGILVFSQEHPLTTSNKDNNRWTRKDAEIQHYNLSYYMDSGKRETTWFIDNVIKYHRTFSDIFSDLINSGFEIENVEEPKPSEKDIELVPRMIKDIHKPNFLIIRAKKK